LQSYKFFAAYQNNKECFTTLLPIINTKTAKKWMISGIFSIKKGVFCPFL
jgi:hypothetical protein